jgi:hypothetical protein
MAAIGKSGYMQLMASVNAIGLFYKGSLGINTVNKLTIESVMAGLLKEGKGMIIDVVDVIEDKGKAREMLTSGTGFNWLSSEINNGALLMYPKLDTATYDALRDQTSRKPKCFDMVLYLQDGSVIALDKSLGTIAGFEVSVSTGGFMLPASGADQAKKQQLYVFFQDNLALENATVIPVDIDPATLRARFEPAGLNMEIISVDTANAKVDVKITDRATGAVVTSLTVDDFVITNVDGGDEIVSTVVIDEATSVYTVEPDSSLLIYNLQVKKTVTSVVTHLSNILTVKSF